MHYLEYVYLSFAYLAVLGKLSGLEMSAASKQQVLSLYRRLLSLHRHVSPSVKSMGIQYIREEFRRHQHVELSRAQEFLQQWRV